MSQTFSLIYEIHVSHGNAKKIEVAYDSAMEEAVPDFASYLKVDYSSSNSMLYLGVDQLPGIVERLKLSSKARTVKVYLEMNDIMDINLSGASIIYFDGSFTSEILNVDLSGTAKFATELDVIGDELSLDCSGAAKVNIVGSFKEAEVDGSAAANITLKGNIDKLKCEISGATKMTYDGANKRCDVECSGAANVELKGKCNEFKIEGSGASRINAKDYCAKTAYVKLAGASNARVQATDELKHSVSAASKLTHFNTTNVIDLSENTNVRAGSL